MARLIKEDDVMRMLTNIELSRTITPIIEAKAKLRDIPTAYDIEGVVNKLKKCSDECKDSSDMYEKGKSFAYKNAISFIRESDVEC